MKLRKASCDQCISDRNVSEVEMTGCGLRHGGDGGVGMGRLIRVGRTERSELEHGRI